MPLVRSLQLSFMVVVELTFVAAPGPVGPGEPGNKKPPTATGAGEGARRRKAR
ncbi:hypothetical protein GJR88_03008 [Dietzia sp. DQ12-45-1b]|nr:hypothetical protein GJR88_03008 [Dietzia sp. DQ12-45-1b]